MCAVCLANFATQFLFSKRAGDVQLAVEVEWPPPVKGHVTWIKDTDGRWTQTVRWFSWLLYPGIHEHFAGKTIHTGRGQIPLSIGAWLVSINPEFAEKQSMFCGQNEARRWKSSEYFTRECAFLGPFPPFCGPHGNIQDPCYSGKWECQPQAYGTVVQDGDRSHWTITMYNLLHHP